MNISIHEMGKAQALNHKDQLIKLIAWQKKLNESLIVSKLENYLRVTIGRIEYLNMKDIWDRV